MSVASGSSIDERKNGDYEEIEHNSQRMPIYPESRTGRVKLSNTNFMYHSTDKGNNHLFAQEEESP